jgi:hypothetical protein
MKIHVKSNFVVPGVVNEEFVDLDRSQLTIGEFLKELAERAPTNRSRDLKTSTEGNKTTESSFFPGGDGHRCQYDWCPHF